MEREIVVYTQHDCGACHAATAYLSRRGVSFRERNIVEDGAAAADFNALGYAATPVIVVDGELMVGFNRRRLDTILEKVPQA